MTQRFDRARIAVGCLCIGLAGLLAIASGCEMNPQRVNAPPQGPTECSNEIQEPLMTMTDNALLDEMSVSPVHFVPRTAELNGTGARRLKRMANILKVYGGTVNYTGFADPDDLAQKRMEQVKEYLLAEGLDRDKFKVAKGLPGGDGMDAAEAVAIREGGRYSAEDTTSGSSSSTITDRPVVASE